MERLSLLLRQRKILNILMHRSGLTTGAELAKQLNISSRTVRSDIAVINRNLEECHARIESTRSKGYQLLAENPEAIRELLRTDSELLTQEGRLRYLAACLCFAEGPANINDLEDEMFISYTTLENDIQKLRETYVLHEPYIRLSYKGRELSFEQDERKRRLILNALFHEHWNYNGNSNTFYEFEYLDRSLLPQVIGLIPPILKRHDILLEDNTLVRLNLACAILVERLRGGHPLPSTPPAGRADSRAAAAAEELAAALEQRFDCPVPPQERDELYRMLSRERILHTGVLSLAEAERVFPPPVVDMADEFLESIRGAFGLDFRRDEDFILTLLSLLRSLLNAGSTVGGREQLRLMQPELLNALELAWLMQPIMQRYTGRYLDEPETLLLANCVRGALIYLLHHNPESKIRTAICCHANMSMAWVIKRTVLSRFMPYINIVGLYPVNVKDTEGFGDADLILSTVHKKLTDDPAKDVLHISVEMSAQDIRNISAYIQEKHFLKLFPATPEALRQVLENAMWQENAEFPDYTAAVRYALDTLRQTGAVGREYAEDVLRREALCSSVIEQGIVFLSSALPAAETRLSVVAFRHRMVLRKCKVRAVAVGCFRPEDRSLLFHCQYLIHRRNQSVDSFGPIRTRAELEELLLNGKPFI